MDTNREAVYEMDGEFCRYQDHLRWSRFQTAAAIEAGLVYAVWGGIEIGKGPMLVALSFGTVLIALICVLAQIDERHYRRHMDRIEEYEKGCPLTEPRVQKCRYFSTLKGSQIMPICSLLLMAFNFFLILYAAISK